LDTIAVADILVGAKEIEQDSTVALPGQAIIRTRAGDAVLTRRTVRLDGQEASEIGITIAANAIGVRIVIVTARVERDYDALSRDAVLVGARDAVVRAGP